MSFWDALSGKTLKWNQMKDQALLAVCRRLHGFVSRQSHIYPQHEEWFRVGRDMLFAFFFGAHVVIPKELDVSLLSYKERFLAMSPRTYLHFISAYQACDIVIRNPGNDNAVAMLLDGMCVMYDRPPSYALSWMELRSLLTPQRRQEFSSRTHFKVYDEVALILGLSQNDLCGSILWGELSVSFASASRMCFERPGWRDAVERQLST